MGGTRLWIVALVLSASAYADPLTAGVDYLVQHQGLNGSFGETTGEEPVVATSEVLTTLRALQLGATPEAQNAELFLVTSPVNVEVELLLRRQQALAPTAWAETPVSGVATGPGFDAPDAHHLARSLMAQPPPATGASSAVALQLAALALPSGCYRYADNDASVTLTADAIAALRPYAYDPLVAPALSASVTCLRGMQQADGSFGSIAATAAAAVALLDAPGANGAALAQARGFLTAIQAPDGSFGGSVRATALALRALGQQSPDWWVLTDERGAGVLVLRNPEPVRGSPFTAELDVQNRSAAQAPAVTVRFFARPLAGGTDVFLSDVTVPPLGPGQSSPVAATLSSAVLRGRYTLYAVVNPGGALPELNIFDNEASAPLNVLEVADLAVASANIGFAAAGAGQVQISVTVTNYGLPLAAPVAVDVYNGDPTVAGLKLGSAALPAGLDINQTSTIAFTWDPGSANGPTAIWAVVDPDNTLTESNEDNNRALRYYYPGITQPVDLAVVGTEMQLSAPFATKGRPITLTIPVHNHSAFDANRVAVTLKTRTRVPIELLGQVEVPIVPANGSAPASFTFSLNETQPLTVEVDPLGQLNDTDRANNTTPTPNVTVRSAGEVEVAVLSASFSTLLSTLSVTSYNDGSQIATTRLIVTDHGDANREVVNNVVSLQPGLTDGQTLELALASTPTVLSVCLLVLPSELNPNDNCAEVQVGSKMADLTVHPRDIRVEPLGPNIGEAVRLSATVRNNRAIASSATVEWWHGWPGSGSSRKLGTTSVGLPANGSADTSFDWVREEGSPEVFVKVSQVLPPDLNVANNVTGRHLFLEGMISRPTVGVTSNEYHPNIRAGRLTGRPQPEVVTAFYEQRSTGNTGGFRVLQQDAAGDYQTLWEVSQAQVGSSRYVVADLVLADIDGNGVPNVVAETFSAATPSGVVTARVTAYEPDGTVTWENVHTITNVNLGDTRYGERTLGVGDVNGDGVPDIVSPDDTLRVISGADGQTILSVATSSGAYAAVRSEAIVLDVDDDGQNEVLTTIGNLMYIALIDRTGAVRWEQRTQAYDLAVADLDVDGIPEIVRPLFRGPPYAWDARTGAPKYYGDNYESYWTSIAIGPLRQDGLPYVVVPNNSFTGQLAAFGTALQLLWHIRDDVSVGQLSLADVSGLGRPQVLKSSPSYPLEIVDGRDGRLLLPPTEASLNYPYSNAYWDGAMPPVVTDLHGDGTSRVIVAQQRIASGDVWTGNAKIDYGAADALVFGSVHWQRQPTAWPTRNLIKGVIDDDLHVTGETQWWKTHNSWNDQFVDAPATLLADLTVSDADVSFSPALAVAGAPVTLTATVHNIGGVPASNAQVAFYDGDPANGGVLLATSAVPGPIAPLTGSGTATASWTSAFPEGAHDIYVVANADHLVEESGEENNTAHARLFVQPGTALCDLAIVAGSVSASPAGAQAGDALALSATVTNQGVATCPGTALSMSDGVTVAEVPIPALAQGQSAQLAFASLARPGTTFFQFVADEVQLVQDANLANNRATLEVFVAASAQPDLWVQTATVTPSPALPGEPIEVRATITNRGAPSTPTSTTLEIGGSPLAQASVPSLLPGASVTVSLDLAAPATTTGAEVRVAPLVEFDLSNNVLPVTLQVTPPLLDASTVATPATAASNTPIGLAVTITNQVVQARTVAVTVQVLAPTGEVAATPLAAVPLLLPPSGATGVSSTWDTAANPPGSYTVRTTVSEGGRQAAHATTTVALLPDVTLAAGAIAADRGSYAPGESALLSFAVANTSANVALQGAVAVVTVRDPSGVALHTEARPVAALQPGTSFTGVTLFDVSPAAAAGRYAVTLDVTQGVTLLAQAAGAFDVTVAAPQLVTGALSAPALFQLGAPLPVAVQLDNASSAGLTGAVLSVELYDPSGPLLVLQASDMTAATVAAQSQASFAFTLPTTAVTVGPKLLVARLDGRVVADMLVEALAQQDFSPPVITVSGVFDGQLTNLDVTPVITITDASAFSSVATLYGALFNSGDTVSTEGAHSLVVTAQDVFQNLASVEVRFELDKTLPVLTLGGVADGPLVNVEPTLTFSAVDANLTAVTSTLDGVPFTSGDTVSTEGSHVWVVTATDGAGNSATETRTFTLDTTPPAVTLSGVADGTTVAGPVTLTWSVSDAHLATVTALLDGTPFASGDIVSADGSHLAVVTATDAAGNSSTATLSFAIDATPPVITIAGVLEGAVVNAPVTLSWQVSDASPTTVTATLDGAAVSQAVSVGSEGPHLLVVSATDGAGNSASATRSFAIDTQAPIIFITVVATGAYFPAPVSPNVTASDAHPASLVVTLDGASYVPLTPITTEGAHVLAAQAFDAAGNTASVTVPFILDFTAPIISASGVSDGATGPSFTPVFSAADASPVTVGATLDGAPFSSGATVSTVGAHVLAITVTDAAGNVASRTITFTVTGGGGGRACVDTTLVATREYAPTRWHDASLSATPPFRFTLPASLSVTRGRSSNKEATLEVSLGCARFTCKYVGDDQPGQGGSQGNGHNNQGQHSGLRYDFDHCTGSAHQLQPGDAVTAGSLTLHVHDGDHHAWHHGGHLRADRASPLRQRACAARP